MSWYLIVHARSLRQRHVRSIVTAAGLAAAAMLVFVVVAVHLSTGRSVDRSLAMAGTADLELTNVGVGLLPHDAAERARDTRGVAEAAPMIRGYVAVDRTRMLLLAVDGTFEAFLGDEADRLEAQVSELIRQGEVSQGDVVLTRRSSQLLDATAGDPVTVHGNGLGRTPRELVVAAVVDLPELDVITDGLAVLTTLDMGKSIAGGVDTVLVDVADGASAASVATRLEEAIPGALVETRAERRERVTAQMEILLQQLVPTLLVAVVVGGFLVFNTISATTNERRREIATMLAIGAPRPLLIRGYIAEALVFGIVGGIAGVLAGMAVAPFVIERLPKFLETAAGVHIVYDVPLWVPVATCSALVAVAAAAAVVPARRAAATPPVAVMRRLEEPPADTVGRATPAILLVAGAVVMGTAVAVAATATGIAAMAALPALLVGFVLLTYGGRRVLAGLAAAASATLGASGRIAASSIVARPTRTWITLSTVAIAAGQIFVVAATGENLYADARSDFSSLRGVDLMASAAPLDTLALDQQLPPSFRDEVVGVPGVEGTTALSFSYAIHEGRQFLLAGLDGDTGFPQFHAAPASARMEVLTGRGLIVTHQFARLFGYHVGDEVVLDENNDDSSSTYRLAAIVTSLAPSENGMAWLSLPNFRRVTGASGLSALEIDTTDGQALSVMSDLHRLAEPLPYPIFLGDGPTVMAANLGLVRQVTLAMRSLLLVVVSIVVLAVGSTLTASILDRRRELAVLRAIGTTGRQTGRVVLVEAAVIAGLGAALGALVGLPMHALAVDFMTRNSPFPASYQFVPLAAFTATIGVMVGALAGSWPPSRRASRMDIVPALATDGEP